MPLEAGSSREVISHNIQEMVKAGHPQKQAVAAALRKSREGDSPDFPPEGAADDPAGELREAIAAGEQETAAERAAAEAGKREAEHQRAALSELGAADAGAGFLLTAPSGRMLFLKRGETQDHPGEWCCPGGSVEKGETPLEAALRELQEETQWGGATALAGRVAGASPIDSRGGFHTFSAEVPNEFVPNLNAENTEYRWASLDSPPAPLHPGTAATLQKLAQAKHGARDLREYDTNGWYEVPDNPLSTVGVYQYSGRSIDPDGKLGLEPGKMYGVYRPAEELGSEETVKSFRLMPWTDDHPSTLLGDERQGLVPAEQKGVHGVIGEQTYFKDDTLYGNLKVFSQALARKIAAGKRELSCGYHCDFVPQEGVFNGEGYQFVQKNLRGNHLSSVPKGRMGSDVRVLDAIDSPRRFVFALDLKEPAVAEKRQDEIDGTVDADTMKLIGDCMMDSFNSLVNKLEGKGYSKEYATKIAGKVAAEKGMTGHRDSKDAGGEVKDPAGSKEETISEKQDLKTEVADRRKARDAKRAARDRMRAKDEMNEEQEEAEDKAEEAEDAEEEREDEKDETKDAKDRKSARDRRSGARDARKHARDRRHAKDKKHGMDASEITALVQTEAGKAAAGARRDAIAAQKLYGRLSPLIGAFDHDEMTLADMASYGLKRLNAPEAKDPVTALDFYLAGRASAPAATTRPGGAAALDSKGDSFMDKFLAA